MSLIFGWAVLEGDLSVSISSKLFHSYAHTQLVKLFLFGYTSCSSVYNLLKMTEKTFNIFIFVENDIIYELGVVVHEQEGTDQEKLAFLQSQLVTDFKKAIRLLLPNRYLIEYGATGKTINALKYEKFRALTQMNLYMQVFEEIFQSFNASQNPLFCLTPVIDGELRIDATQEVTIPNEHEIEEVKSVEFWFSDYLTHYMSEEGFDLSRLINDDYLLAIKLLYNNGHYVSALKLLMSFIDTLAFLEFDDTPRNFHRWLDQYVDLNDLEIVPDELWEMRNSLLHMTNSDSRKVRKGEVKRLMFYIGTLTKELSNKSDEAKYFELMGLIRAIAYGIDKWANSYNIERPKFQSFVDRYDRIVSIPDIKSLK